MTTGHIATIPVRNPDIVPIGRFYGTVVRTCVPADPASKGGAENAVKLAKRDLVPTSVNLRAAYTSFAELEQACAEFTAEVNARVRRETRRAPAEMVAEERFRLHRLPDHPYTAVFGQSRLATATVDRLLHHAHVVVTTGDSHRLSEATNGNGVVALA